MISALFQLCFYVIRLYIWAFIISAVFSTLASFNIIDTRNRLVHSIGDFLYRVTEPALRPIRRVLPNFGNIDLSPLVAILLLQYVATPALATLYSGIVYGSWTLI